MKPSTTVQHTAYRQSLCIDCTTVRYSAGRPRCNACHATYEAALAMPCPSWTPPPPSSSWGDSIEAQED
jgi:hypothetical protein